MNKAASALAKLRWAKRDIEKTCAFCGRAYRGVPEQVYCSPRHQNAAAARRSRERRRAVPTPLARALGQAERCRAADDLEGALRWEQIAAGIAAALADEHRA